MNKQVLNVSWGADKKQSLTFNKTDSVYLVKSYLENITRVSVKDQQLLGLETNDDSLPLAVLEIENPQNVYLLNKNDFNISSLNEPQITVVKDPEVNNKEDENQNLEKKEQEKSSENENENKKEQEQDQEQEQENENEEENKKEKEKETKNQKDENENGNEKETKTEKGEKFDPDLELAKQLQEQMWKQDLTIPKTTKVQDQGQNTDQTNKGVGKGFGSEDLQRNTGSGIYYPPNYMKKIQQLRMRHFQREKERKEFENRQSLEMMAPFAPPSIGSDEVLKKKFVEYSDSIELPLISTEGFAEVCLTGKEIKKPILIYLHSYTKDQENVSHFMKSVLGKQGIINLINQNFIFWVGDIDALESIEEMKELLNLKEFPYLAVLSNNPSLEILEVIQGAIKTDDLTNTLLKQLQLLPNKSFGIFQNDYKSVQKSETVIEREKQDLDFELSRQKDLEFFKLQEQILQSQQELKLQKELELDKIHEMIPDEPKNGEKNVTVLKIRLKNGEKLQRKFYSNDKLSSVFHLVKWTIKSFQKFKLISSYPKKTFLEDENFVEKSLEELGLVPQALLDIEFVD
ncbi:fas-associated protein [Anaeramoeba flamelloides]|uniref:Fas-associated protein n=1 Tax=Anaeramoeba flamelloides TaxID=1746091 RepID=A0AAV7ZHS4_9EUKA|nr:fas-associated protein [Anaeramoeba flamelloides]